MKPKASPAFLFGLLAVVWVLQAATLGISDDEAYYWVLSRTPALGYVYHPPLVAWLIRASEQLLGWSALPRELVVRIPGILMSGATVLLAAGWIRRNRPSADARSLSWFILPGLAAMTWMMVPDHSLLLGWMLCFRASWAICESDHPRGRDLAILALGAAIGLLSKFSAILYCGSASLCLVLFARRSRLQSILALFIGIVVAAAPILIWNARNDWVAILYQFKSRHQGASFDLRRWGAFWASQLLFAGPLLMAAGAALVSKVPRRRLDRAEMFVALWAAPAAIFLFQPAFSAFKPHWALVFWLPVGVWAALQPLGRLARFHLAFTAGLLVISIAFTQFPLSSVVTRWWTGRDPNPLWDVSNDLAGWSELPRIIAEQHLETELPVLGSRYQTAAQAAFALWPAQVASLVPASPAEQLEWPRMDGAFDETSPGNWPRLLRPVLYIHDDRYQAGPAFLDATCERRASIDAPRYGVAPKRVHLWYCHPR
jgi:4-amino-4-deoxy-L-arabinose transferase-like glycosyltransferase